MTDDKDLRDTFVHLSAATAQVVKDAFRMRADWKKRNETDAAIRALAASNGAGHDIRDDAVTADHSTTKPTEGEAVGSAREGK